MSPSEPTGERVAELGRAIRARRRERGLTLVALAEAVELSQPFLSQIETGRAQPSLVSLYRIAHELGTTPQAFFGGAAADLERPHVVRAGSPGPMDDIGTIGWQPKPLVPGGAPLRAVEFSGLPKRFPDHLQHDGFEFIHVVRGTAEIDLDGEITRLGVGDSMSYLARIPHRFRAAGRGKVSLLLVETAIEAIGPPTEIAHAASSRSQPGSGTSPTQR